MFKTIEAKASKEQAKKQKMSKWFSMPSLDEPWNRNSYKGKRCVRKLTSLKPGAVTQAFGDTRSFLF